MKTKYLHMVTVLLLLIVTLYDHGYTEVKPDADVIMKEARNARNNQDYAKASKLYTKACNMGNAEGCAEFGNLYDNGLGVKKDSSEAIGFYTKACNMGDPYACSTLGWRYSHGEGVKQDDTTASKFYIKADELRVKYCNMEDGSACYSLGISYRSIANDFILKACDFWAKACDKGDAKACTALAARYSDGEGVIQSKTKSKELSLKACNMGDGGGCFKLGIFYALEKKSEEAKEFFKRACDLDKIGCDDYNKLINK